MASFSTTIPSNGVSGSQPHAPLVPRAKPPAAAPPPPEEETPLLAPGNYGSIPSSSRAIEPPTIRSENIGDKRWWGNSSLLPNVGLTNSYDTSCVAIHEAIRQLRTVVCSTGAASLLLLFFTWLGRLVTFDWGRLVVSLYMGFLALLLTVAEGSALLGWDGMEKMSLLKTNFGFVYHPVGKPSLLLFMATLCWALRGTVEILFGCVYFIILVIVLQMNQIEEFRENYYPDLTTIISPEPSASRSASSQSWTTVLYDSYSEYSSRWASSNVRDGYSSVPTYLET